MKRVVVLLALVALAGPALAYEIAATDPAPLSAGVQSLGGAATRTDIVYSCIPPASPALAGYGPGPQPPYSEIGDELQMTAGGVLDSVKFTVYNSSSTSNPGPLTTADLTLKFYNWDDTDPNAPVLVLAGTVGPFDNVATNLNLGYYTVFTITGLATSNIVLENVTVATLTISDATGGANRFGQLVANPPTVGASANDFYRDGSWLWFGGTPYANLAWEIGIVPEPAALALLLGGLLLRRR